MPVEIQSAKPYYGLDEDNYADWNGARGVRRRFEFETLYLDRDFTLASAATLRPDGAVKVDGQMPFSEVNLWRLAVKGGQLFGNAGANDTMTGRSPFEEIAQYGNVMFAVKGTDRVWVAVPRAMRGGVGRGDIDSLGRRSGGTSDGARTAQWSSAAAALGVERCGVRAILVGVPDGRTGGAGDGSG